MLLYIVRHGEPIYSPVESLTPLGKRQAEAVGRRLCLHGIDEIYTSPLTRAKETAQPLCEMLHKEAKVEEWASENFACEYFSYFDEEKGKNVWAIYGPSAGMKNVEAINNDEWFDVPPFNKTKAREGWAILKEKSDAFTASLGYEREGLIYKIKEPSNKKIAMFCHHGFGTTWLSYLLGIPPFLFWTTFDITHTGVVILEFRNNKDGYTAPKCLSFDDVSHIYAENLPFVNSGGIKL